MANREPIQYIEIDMEYCTSSYGTGTCTALLGTTGIRKCFNSYATCQDKTNFAKTTITFRFIHNRANLPKGYSAYPCLKDDGVSAMSGTVNIAGSDPRMNAFGRRATISVNLKDFIDDDIGYDKYQGQRVNGLAQSSGIGYNPLNYGTFFSKFKARFPYYSGRPLRYVEAYIEGDSIVVETTRHFIITDFKGPDSDGNVTIEGKDILALADDKKALAPKTSRGKLKTAITSAIGQVFDLIPTGIGAEYASSGYATIGSEVVTFTRSVDTITITGRGLDGTVAASHNVNDAFQEALHFEDARLDNVIYTLLTTYAKVDPSFCPLVTEWEPEITTWMSSALVTATITKPTGVAQLLGELADLGVSIWWDEVAQKIKILATHPVKNELITPISDNLDIKAITQEDFDEDRITQVHVYTKLSDVTKDYKDKSNYDQINVLIDTDSESELAYNDTKVREIFCRWFNKGADSVVRVISLRLLKRLKTPPVHYTITLDANYNQVNLTDVLEVESGIVTDDMGVPVKKLMQILKKTTKKSGHEVAITVQSFLYEGKYGIICENTYPVYSSASTSQKKMGAWFVDSTLKFSNGDNPYLFI